MLLLLDEHKGCVSSHPNLQQPIFKRCGEKRDFPHLNQLKNTINKRNQDGPTGLHMDTGRRSSTQYAGKYTTHDFINRNTVIDQVSRNEVDFELGEHTPEYNSQQMNVELKVTNQRAQFMYDDTFEEELGEENFTT